MENIENLKVHLTYLKNDLQANNVDLYVARIEAKSLLTKSLMLLEKIQEVGEQHKEILNFVHEIKRLIETISHEIQIQEKEEHFRKF
ncbi:MAG: hypothetical protein J6Q13_01480 [Clostridia bacterium]|nr:hypothetical protein [Clostridia bacterium]